MSLCGTPVFGNIQIMEINSAVWKMSFSKEISANETSKAGDSTRNEISTKVNSLIAPLG